MSQRLHMSNWMAVGSGPNKRENENARPLLCKKPLKPDSYKTVMCQAWLECKVCIFGSNCRFAHGEPELRPSDIMPKKNGKYKTKLCDKYTTTGLCPYGSRCLFIHPIHPDGGTNAYIRPDKLVEVTQRHALADMNARNRKIQSSRPITPIISANIASSEKPAVCSPWALAMESNFFSDKNSSDGKNALKNLFGCFESATPNRVSLASGLSGYGSGASSPFSTISSTINLNTTSDDEHFERDYFRLTGLEHLAEELTRNLTSTSELW